MNKKDENVQAPNRRSWWLRERWSFMITGAVLACLLILGLFASTRPITVEPLDNPTTYRYPGESIAWEGCGHLKNGRRLECSTITVPIDQFTQNPEVTDATFTIPLIRLRGHNATQNLLLNPGGPGGSGIWFMHRLGAELHTIVGEDFHLVAFDPRGVNGSRPLATCYPDAETRRARGPVRDKRVLEDSPELYAWSANYVRACADTMGVHGMYLNTPQTAADMNSILVALGQEDMVYWGFSYGTILGQTYAALYPERSRRVIIDGVNNVFDWYSGLLDEEDLVDSERVFDGFLEECVKAGRNCPLTHFGTSREVLRERILGLAETLYSEPVSVYVDNERYGVLDDRILLYEAIPTALRKSATWPALARNLALLLDGNATEAFLAYALDRKPWPKVGDAERFVMLNDGASGAKHWPGDRKTMLEWLVPFMNRSIFAPTEHGIYYAKQQWQIPKTHSFTPPHLVHTAHPLLILTTSFDPVCPLISARSAQRAFEGSQIVEVLGYGHCSTAVPSLCLARHVRAFLKDGIVPEAHVRCEVDEAYAYFPGTDDGENGVELREVDGGLGDEEDVRLSDALVELARGAW
ncbi:alpha/beta-hydrolase [Xylaria venustula]|nr:alpha/beta-hydrolase [Xylaria venustula]